MSGGKNATTCSRVYCMRENNDLQAIFTADPNEDKASDASDRRYMMEKPTIKKLEFKAIQLPEQSEWICYLFGSRDDCGILWTPPKGGEPNWFWRWTQGWAFGNRWVKK